MPKYRDPLPAFLPTWLQRRVEVDNYRLYEFMERAGHALPTTARVLDAGAGEGKYKDVFAHTRYTGIDMAVGDAQWDYTHLDVIGSLTHLPFASDSFDAIICTQVLEHVPEPAWVLAELTRLLRPGGQLFLSVPQSWYQHQKPHDYYRYTSFGIRYLLEQAGLQVTSIETMGGYFWYLSFTLQHFNYWLFPKNMPGRKWTWPLRLVFGLFFQILAPLLLFYLDPLDRIQDETFGYMCVALRPAQ